MVLYSDEQAIAALLDGADLPQVESGEDAARSIMARILASEDVDAVFQDSAAVAAQDVLDETFTLTDFRLMKSSYEDGPNVFGILDAVDVETGESRAITCGARNVMAQAFRLKTLGALPLAVKIRKADKPTAAGFYPLWLARGE